MTRLRQYAAGAAIGFITLLSGCADRPMSVPSSAHLMTEGNGDRITFRPTEYGRVYVTDQTDANRIIYQGEVDRGDTVELNSKDDRVMVAGRTVTERPMDSGHQYKIFFEPMTKERVVRYKETVVEEHPTKP
jgi:signal peptidase I